MSTPIRDAFAALEDDAARAEFLKKLLAKWWKELYANNSPDAQAFLRARVAPHYSAVANGTMSDTGIVRTVGSLVTNGVYDENARRFGLPTTGGRRRKTRKGKIKSRKTRRRA